MELPFEERPNIKTDPSIFELYVESEAQYLTRNWRRLNLTIENNTQHSVTGGNLITSSSSSSTTIPGNRALSIITMRDKPSSRRRSSKDDDILTLDEFCFPEWLPISLPRCLTQTLVVPLANGRVLNDVDLYELNE